MDHKTWLWRKRSSEKTIIANDKDDLSHKGNEEEMLPSEKEVALERSVENLNEKLASILSECNAKDDLVVNHAKMAQEAMAGREKAEAEAVSLKQELDEALQQRVAANERLTHVNAALKEYMQQLSSVREEQEQRVYDAVMKTSKEFEKAHKKLEEKFMETNKRLANLTVENSQLSKALLVKDKLIEDLGKRKSQAEAEFNTLMARLDSTEKENAFLKYEYRMIEKELEIRNEEMEFNRRSADESHKQHLVSVKKITKLEAECQRLRVLVRKRLPGPAALAKMKSEVEIQGRNQIEIRRKKMNLMVGGLLVSDSTIENPTELPSKNITLLIERICDLEEENKLLKDILSKRDDELHSSRTIFARTASKLSQVEAQLGELSNVQKSMELAKCSPVSNELSLTSSFDIGSDDGIVRSGSWASALISELEHLRNGETDNTSECKMSGVTDISLMDDFVEMEKLAIVAVDASSGSSYVSSDVSHALSDSLTKESSGNHLDSTGKELVPMEQVDSGDMEAELQTKNLSSGKTRDWLQDVLNLVLEQSRVSKRSLDELLEDIRIALQYMDRPSPKQPEPSKLLPISGYITWKSLHTYPRVSSFKEKPDIGTSVEENEGLRDELKNMKSLNKDLEVRLQLANDKSEALVNQLRESEQRIGSLQSELETLKESKSTFYDQIENQKSINEDLDTQLTVSNVKFNEVLQKLSSLEVELEDRSRCCEELEATCLELQLQLESITMKEIPKDNVDQQERLHQTGWEITTATAKLAECQETIFNLGKQLKALASPKESAVFDKVLSTTSNTTTHRKKLSQHSSLRDQMLAEDGAKSEDLKSPKTKEIISTVETKRPSIVHSTNCNFLYASNVQVASPEASLGRKNEVRTAAAGALAIVPGKKRGVGSSLLRKLLLRRKRGTSKKTPSFAT